MKRTRVMVVDDEAIVCNRLRHPLEKVGYLVETTTDSDRALKALDSAPFDVVVTHLQMKGPTGLNVLHSVRNRGLSTRGILITEVLGPRPKRRPSAPMTSSRSRFNSKCSRKKSRVLRYELEPGLGRLEGKFDL